MKWIALAVLLFSASTGLAATTWIVTGQVQGPFVGCSPIFVWYADAHLHNATAADANVVVTASNGTSQSITLAATRSASVGSAASDLVPANGIAALRIDAPDVITVEGRLEYAYVSTCVVGPPIPGPVGKSTFPVFHLSDAGVEQRHYGTDLGYQQSRINVGIYNDGGEPALALIRVSRPGCTATTTNAVAVIPPKTLTQTTVAAPKTCEVRDLLMPAWAAETTVVVDQPSFSYASVLSNQQAPVTSFTVGTPGQ